MADIKSRVFTGRTTDIYIRWYKMCTIFSTKLEGTLAIQIVTFVSELDLPTLLYIWTYVLNF